MATRAEWVERVERWERSGLSAEKFARREGYKPKQLYWWRWKLRADGPSPSSLTEAPRFLPVHVMTDASPVAAEPIEIALPNGRVVRVRPGFDPATLERVLLLAAEEVPC
ncbi:IS66 family insertion sequence element accessory protein TnpB [Sorangium sp. So ce269]